MDYILDNELDMLAITETWISTGNSNDHTIKDLPVGYNLSDMSRPSRRGSGVAIIYRDCVNPLIQPKFSAKSFESLEDLITIDSCCIRLILLYGPPPSTANGLTKAMFLQEFGDNLELSQASIGTLLVAGDFNFH